MNESAVKRLTWSRPALAGVTWSPLRVFERGRLHPLDVVIAMAPGTGARRAMRASLARSSMVSIRSPRTARRVSPDGGRAARLEGGIWCHGERGSGAAEGPHEREPIMTATEFEDLSGRRGGGGSRLAVRGALPVWVRERCCRGACSKRRSRPALRSRAPSTRLPARARGADLAVVRRRPRTSTSPPPGGPTPSTGPGSRQSRRRMGA